MHGKAPTDAQTAGELKMSMAEYQALLQDMQGCQLVYLEDFAQDQAENTFLDQHTHDAGQDRCIPAGCGAYRASCPSTEVSQIFERSSSRSFAAA